MFARAVGTSWISEIVVRRNLTLPMAAVVMPITEAVIESGLVIFELNFLGGKHMQTKT